MAPVYCTECGFDNEESRASCVICYTNLADADTGAVCSQCGTDNPAAAKFCSGCGNQLDPMGNKTPSRKELGELVLESMSGAGGLIGQGGAADEEEGDFAPLGGSDEFEVADVAPAAAAPTPSAAAAPAGTEDEDELPPPRVSTADQVDMSKLAAPPPPPPAGGAAPPPPPPPPPPAGATTAPPPAQSAPDSLEIDEDEDDDFLGWELDTGDDSSS